MSKTSLRFGLKTAMAAVLAFGMARPADAGNVTTTVFSNNPAPGDAFTGSPSPGGGQAVGSSGWSYANVRTGAGYSSTIGIDGSIPDDGGGNGSVHLSTNGGSAKADISYSQGVASLGLLKDLTSLSFDYYRKSGGSALNYLAPSIRIWIDNGKGSSGYLVWENSQNTLSAPIVTDQWVPVNAIGQMFWSTGNLPFHGEAFDHHYTLSDWLNTYLTNGDEYYITEVNAGVGSGWTGTFDGAVDHIKFGFNGNSTTYDFEVVPEPAGIVMGLIAGGLGLAGASWRRNRREG